MIIITTTKRLRKVIEAMITEDVVLRHAVARGGRAAAKDWLQDRYEEIGKAFNVGSHPDGAVRQRGAVAGADRVSAISQKSEISTSEVSQNEET